MALDGLDLCDPLISPLFGDWNGIYGVGKMMIVVGQTETLYPDSEIVRDRVDRYIAHTSMEFTTVL